jgi:hypothetical protein
VKDIVFLLNERDRTVSEKASLDLAQEWFDHGASVTVYKFPTPPPPVQLQSVPCRGFRCSMKRSLKS